MSFQYKDYIFKWLSGEICGTIKDTMSGHIRKYLFTTKGKKCEICGWAEINPITGKTPLAIDHIDGDWKNNRLENLKILCPNHHSLTPTYGILNRGRGRLRKGKIC